MKEVNPSVTLYITCDPSRIIHHRFKGVWRLTVVTGSDRSLMSRIKYVIHDPTALSQSPVAYERQAQSFYGRDILE